VPLCAAVIEQTMDRPRPACSAARLVAWGSIPLGALAGGFLSTASGAQTVLLILTGIMGAVAGAATLVRGMRQLPPPSRPGKHPSSFDRMRRARHLPAQATPAPPALAGTPLAIAHVRSGCSLAGSNSQ
jgi:hypothetical protein